MAIFRVDVQATIRRKVEVVASGHEEALGKAFKKVEQDDEVTETISAHSDFLRGR